MNISRNFIFLLLILAFFACRENNVPDFSLDPIPQTENNAFINITSPAYLENWFPGTRQIIKWDVEKDITRVDILLYRKDIKIMTIASKVDNNSYYNWMVPQNLNYSRHYRIKIVDALSNSRENFSNYFYIIENP